MNSMNNQKGNLLFTMLGVILLIVVVMFCVGLALYPTTTITNDKYNIMTVMVDDVKNTSFAPVMKSKIDLALQDGKISNIEYRQIEELYNGYKISISAKSESQYITNSEKSINTLISTNAAGKEGKEIMTKFTIFFIIISASIFSIFMYKTVRAQYP